jgi:pyrimidine-nucleoside phosphorylase
MEVTYVLGGAMLWLGKKASSVTEGIERCKDAIASGRAYEKFRQVVQRQGGDPVAVDHLERYPASRHVIAVRSEAAGYVTGYATMQIGLLAIELGAGRTRMDDVIDPKAGITLTKKIGEPVVKGEQLATIYTDRTDVAERAVEALRSFIHIGREKPNPPPTIHSYIDEHGIKSWESQRL